MNRLVPALEFLHELRAAGLEVDDASALEQPQAWWSRLPLARRSLLLARHEVPASLAEDVRLRALRRRGRLRGLEEVVVELAPQAPGRLAARWGALRHRPLRPGEARLLTVAVPPVRFEDGPTRGAARPALALLDAAWDGDPYDPAAEPDLCAREPLPGLRELEGYWVDEPFARVAILRDGAGEKVYHVDEPRLSGLEKALAATLNERLRDVLVETPPSGVDPHEGLLRAFFGLLQAYRLRVERASAYRIGYHFLRNYLGSGRIEPLMRDPHIEDVSCNGVGVPLFVAHAAHQNLRTNIAFDEAELNSFVLKLAQRGGKLLSVAQPLVDATLPDGSRVQACLGREVTSRGSAFTIRKFRDDPLTCIDLVRSGAHSLDTMALLWLAVELRCSIVVMGATASGKTTMLNCLSQFIPPTAKIVSIEDTREITLHQQNWLAALTRDAPGGAEAGRISMYDLLRAALRQRPDYLLVGEIRGSEGLTLFQAMSTGHTCFSTMHAGSVENAVYRLENAPIGVPRVMLTSLDFLLLQGQVEHGGRLVRRMLSLTEIHALDPQTRNLRTSEVFRWDAAADAQERAAPSQVLDQVRARRGWTRGRLEQELAARREVLAGLLQRGERHYLQVARAVQAHAARAEAPSSDAPGALAHPPRHPARPGRG